MKISRITLWIGPVRHRRSF